MRLSDPVSSLPKTSSVTVKKMASAGIATLRDLLLIRPNRYEDYRKLISADTLHDEAVGTCSGVVLSAKQIFTRSRITIQHITIRDTSGEISIQFFNQRFLLQTVKPGLLLSCSGNVKRFGSNLVFIPKTYEIGPPAVHTGRLIPIYPEIKGMSTRLIREKICLVLRLSEKIEDSLPYELVTQNQLVTLDQAITHLHRPADEQSIQDALKRLSFEELLKVQLATKLLRKHWNTTTKNEPDIVTDSKKKIFDSFVKTLPFTLTDDQTNAVQDIIQDFSSPKRMNRFVQGDVGSGKTIVSLLSALYIYLCNKKILYMAPTEILAEQQYNTFKTFLEPIGCSVALITGSTKQKHMQLPDITIGTQALLTRLVESNEVGLIIIDEQHRFGVKQRALLSQKGVRPHVLTMTATPIPRTVALTIFGDLDMSVINTMPRGRKEVKTLLVSDHKRSDAYQWMNARITDHHEQVFVVCPLIENSSHETMQTVKSATAEYERLKSTVFPNQTIALLHGKMKAEDKSAVLKQFSSGTISVLVSTSVVEVGIDIPNATIMCIEGAERFGLAQLHQLRGRVGRSVKQSFCLLFPSNPHSESSRLKFFTHHSNGMELAEFDLKVRGPGSIYGFEQHGYLDLQFADLSDTLLIEKTQHAAEFLLNRWQESDFPELYRSVVKTQKELVAKD